MADHEGGYIGPTEDQVIDWTEADDYRDDAPDEDDGDDRYDEYKDDLAMGYINPDGSQREPDESAYLEMQAREEEQEHQDEAHGGGPCTCPPPAADPQPGSHGPVDPWEGTARTDEPPF
jgi:hypothetical protein